jgi:pimeloyl-ACP methyl ester carboxylesterase
MAESSQNAILFIHGFPLSAAAWRPQTVALRIRHRPLAWNLPGFGGAASLPESGPITMDRYAEWLAGRMTGDGIERAVIAGHSMGGYIALAFAQRFPGKTRALALVATRSGADTPEGIAGRKAMAQRIGETGPQAVIDAMAPKMTADPALEPDVRHLMAGTTRDGAIGALLGMAERPDLTGFLNEIGIPVWIVTGDRDLLIPKTESERMAGLTPGSTLTVIPGAGHLVAFEKPSEFNAAMTRWLADLP